METNIYVYSQNTTASLLVDDEIATWSSVFSQNSCKFDNCLASMDPYLLKRAVIG